MALNNACSRTLLNELLVDLLDDRGALDDFRRHQGQGRYGGRETLRLGASRVAKMAEIIAHDPSRVY